jgi:hypothetical protein
MPFVLLMFMTAATVGGPLSFGVVLRGGASREWPPDRPVEWFMLVATSGLVLVLMSCCFWLGWSNMQAEKRVRNGPTVPGNGDDTAS